MPKAAKYALVWSAERGIYELHEQENSDPLFVAADDLAWFAWLETHSAFAFGGQSGRVSLLKEARKGGAGYWYAYRRQGQRTVKHYAGRSAELTIARLEATVAALVPQTQLSGLPLASSSDTVRSNPASHAPPLLTPKLQLPRLSAGLVERERLFAQLNAGLERKLTLLAAPAGFGKTTLVRQWLEKLKIENEKLKRPHNHDHFQFSIFHFQFNPAWVSLDDGDNDPVRFWRYVITACQGAQGDLGHAALALLATTLQPPFNPLSPEMLLTPFLNDLARQTQRTILVLEDYHLITEPQIHAAMTFFLDHLPATLHLVILTRSEPPLPLARMRAGGDLSELHTTDLRFSLEETQRFLQQTLAISLAPEAIAQLDTSLEGWAAGLRLLALALPGREQTHEIAHVLATFVGSHRSVLDYFVVEVLNAQPPAIQDFLLRTSTLDRLTGPLCDAVLEIENEKLKIEKVASEIENEKLNIENAMTGALHSQFSIFNSQLLLEELARLNLFLEPLDGTGAWYRYHRLFADAMRFEARRRLGDAVLRGVSSTASAWYEQRGLLAEAVEAALQAQEFARAAVLIEQIVANPQFIFTIQLFAEANESHTLRRWLEQLPAAVLRQHPLICLSYAIALLFLLMTGRATRPTVARLESALQMAEDGFRATNNLAKLGEVFGFRSMITMHDGAIDASVSWARQALTLLPAEQMSWRGASLSSIGTGEQFAGRLDLARKLFIEARAISEAVENWGFTRAIIGRLSGVYSEQGELHQAAALLRRTLAEAREQGDRDDVAHAQIGLMQLSYEWNALDAAEQQAQEAYAIGEQLADEEFQVRATLMLAQIEHVRGQTASAQQRIATLLDRLQPQQSPRTRWYARDARAAQAWLYIATGDLAAAQRWADGRAHDAVAISCLQHEREEQLVARLLLAQGQADAAFELLAGLLATAQRAGHTRCGLETQVLLVLAHAARKQLPEARQLLQAVLARAASEGYMRLFLDAGPALATIMRACLPALRDPLLATYLQTLVHAFTVERRLRDAAPGDSAHPASLAEPLSPQEQRVLQLLVAGRSNPEIAQQLVVSVNTVKAHLKNIYRKLNVRNRMQAAAASSEF